MTNQRKPCPPAWLVRRYYDYDAETGELLYRVNCGTRGKRGSVVGTSRVDGYKQCSLEGTIYLLHTLVWVHQTGEAVPKGMQMDHVNHNRADNRLANLRCVTPVENYRNTSARRNASGHRGVVWSSRKGMWRAYITTRGKRSWLGMHRNIEDAIAARLAAEVELGFHPNHGLTANEVAANVVASDDV